DWSVGMRLGVVTQVNATFLVLPNASCANRRATWTSYPSFFPRTSMNPNGGKSHLTPISQCLRLFTAAGNGGSFGFFGFGFAFTAAAGVNVRPDAATVHAAKTAATSSSDAAAIAIRLIQPLLLRL